MERGEKAAVRVPDDIRRAWDEVRVCATLIRKGQARIVKVTKEDGSVHRYTKLGGVP